MRNKEAQIKILAKEKWREKGKMRKTCLEDVLNIYYTYI